MPHRRKKENVCDHCYVTYKDKPVIRLAINSASLEDVCHYLQLDVLSHELHLQSDEGVIISDTQPIGDAYRGKTFSLVEVAPRLSDSEQQMLKELVREEIKRLKSMAAQQALKTSWHGYRARSPNFNNLHSEHA